MGRKVKKGARMQTRAKSSTVRVRAAVTPAPQYSQGDALGVVMVGTGLVMLVALVLGNAGAIGEALSAFFRMLFGQVVWAVPFFFGLLGVALLAGKKRLEATRLTWGATLLFLALDGAFARSNRGDFFDPEIVFRSGGYVGAIVGFLLNLGLGSASVVGVGVLGALGLIFCIKAPLRQLPQKIKEVLPLRKTEPLGGESDGDRKKRAVVTLASGNREESEPEKPSRFAARLAAEVAEVKEKPTPLIREQTPQTLTISDQPTPKEGYKLPQLSLLQEPQAKPKRSPQEIQDNISKLEGTLEEFGIEANVVEIATGPTITRYEIQLGPGIRVARITALADNIAMNMAASQVRVEAPIPGKAAIGVEVPNSTRSMVTLREVCDQQDFLNHPSRLVVALGQDVSGVNQFTDLTKMPHLLIGGATNSGKSIGLAGIIMSLLMRNTPKDVKLVMIDPKRVELTLFDAIPHLMCPVVRDVKEAPGVLRAVVREMDRRYDLFADAQVRNIDGWNAKSTFAEKLPYIVVILDELADLMIQAANEVETSICRLAQLARATGIHLVIATQRPSVNVITGTIKTNIPSRMAFAVSTGIDSRVILDQVGAERLIGRGDMLFMPIDANKPVRIQGCYVSEKEIEAVCDHWREQEKPSYVLNPMEIAKMQRELEIAENGGNAAPSDNDQLWEEVVRWVVERGQASTSMLQRRFAIGFQRASRIVDLMEERGIIGPKDGAKPREVLVNPMDVESLFGGQAYYDSRLDAIKLDE